MEPKRSKYDTNPLDEDVADRATDAFEPDRPAQTENVFGGPTREIRREEHDDSESEAPTRHINDKFTAYPSIFVPPPLKPTATYEPPRVSMENIYQPPPVPPPNIYQPPPLPVYQKPGSNIVSGLGVPERWAVIFPYLPFWLAIAAAVIELILVPRSETKVRFHAAQGLVLQVAVTAMTMLLTFAGLITGRWSGASLFKFATFVFFIVAMVRVWKGKTFVIPPLEDLTKWVDEKIKPRK